MRVSEIRVKQIRVNQGLGVLYVIPSTLFSFLPYYCHSFRITVIPSRLLSFLLYYCHSFRIFVIPSILGSFLPNIVIPSELLQFQIFFILNSSNTLPYPKGEKNGHRRWPYMRVILKGLRLSANRDEQKMSSPEGGGTKFFP